MVFYVAAAVCWRYNGMSSQVSARFYRIGPQSVHTTTVLNYTMKRGLNLLEELMVRNRYQTSFVCYAFVRSKTPK